MGARAGGWTCRSTAPRAWGRRPRSTGSAWRATGTHRQRTGTRRDRTARRPDRTSNPRSRCTPGLRLHRAAVVHQLTAVRAGSERGVRRSGPVTVEDRVEPGQRSAGCPGAVARAAEVAGSASVAGCASVAGSASVTTPLPTLTPVARDRRRDRGRPRGRHRGGHRGRHRHGDNHRQQEKQPTHHRGDGRRGHRHLPPGSEHGHSPPRHQLPPLRIFHPSDRGCREAGILPGRVPGVGASWPAGRAIVRPGYPAAPSAALIWPSAWLSGGLTLSPPSLCAAATLSATATTNRR